MFPIDEEYRKFGLYRKRWQKAWYQQDWTQVEDVNTYYWLYNKRYRSSNSNPNWRKQIAAGQNATTNFDGEVINDYLTLGYCDTTREPDNDLGGERMSMNLPEWSNTFYSPPKSVDYSLVSEADAAALTAAHKYTRQRYQSMQGLTALGEMRETLRMLRQPAAAFREGLGKYLNGTKKLRSASRTPKQFAKAAAGSWLEYVFGWQPLLNDVKSLAEGIARLSEQMKSTQERRHFNAVRDKWSSTGPHRNGGWPYRFHTTSYNRTSVRYIVSYKMQTGDVRVSDVLGTNLSEIIPTAWELVPWSFAVDYFTNVGDIIEAASTIQADILWICKTERAEQFYSCFQAFDLDYFNLWNGIPEQHKGGGVGSTTVITRHAKGVRRRGFQSLGIPPLQFTLPGMRQGFNLAALATQIGSARWR